MEGTRIRKFREFSRHGWREEKKKEGKKERSLVRMRLASLPSIVPRFLYAPSLSVHVRRGEKNHPAMLLDILPSLAVSSYRDIASESACNPLYAYTKCVCVQMHLLRRMFLQKFSR